MGFKLPTEEDPVNIVETRTRSLSKVSPIVGYCPVEVMDLWLWMFTVCSSAEESGNCKGMITHYNTLYCGWVDDGVVSAAQINLFRALTFMSLSARTLVISGLRKDTHEITGLVSNQYLLLYKYTIINNLTKALCGWEN